MKKVDVPSWGTQGLLQEICRRSAEGEAVRDVIAGMNLDVKATMLWLRDHHHAEIVAAKQEQNKRKKEKENGADKTNT